MIIGPGPYTNAHASIAGNGPHKPFANQKVTFTLALAGVTASILISNVVFSFGTGTGTNVAVPIPVAVWLFVSGLLGLIGIARCGQGERVARHSLSFGLHPRRHRFRNWE